MYKFPPLQQPSTPKTADSSCKKIVQGLLKEVLGTQNPAIPPVGSRMTELNYIWVKAGRVRRR